MIRSSVAHVSFLGFFAVCSACDKVEEVTYTQFNALDDALEVEVGIEDLLDPVNIDLHSNTGSVIVGWADVTPGGGPSGTLHTIRVEVFDDYQDIVDRVSVRTTSGNRGEDEYDLDPDYFDEGLYLKELQSVAGEGETRIDTLTIRLWNSSADVDTGG
jgi:hypothetical protein